jgi:hypothetical protein
MKAMATNFTACNHGFLVIVAVFFTYVTAMYAVRAIEARPILVFILGRSPIANFNTVSVETSQAVTITAFHIVRCLAYSANIITISV